MTKLTDVRYLVVHVTATRADFDIGTKEIDAMHRQRGFSSIGYHYVIRRNGLVELGRPESDYGAHVQGFNSVSLGVAMVGGIDKSGQPQDNATPAQYAALEALLRQLSERYPDAKVCGHRDLSPDRNGDGVIDPQEHIKACPCFDAIPWAVSKGLPAANIRGSWSGKSAPIPKAPDARSVYLQRLLARAGYVFGALDGDVGPRTQAAIRQFQLWAGLPETGDFDKATVRRLRVMYEGAPA